MIFKCFFLCLNSLLIVGLYFVCVWYFKFIKGVSIVRCVNWCRYVLRVIDICFDVLFLIYQFDVVIFKYELKLDCIYVVILVVFIFYCDRLDIMYNLYKSLFVQLNMLMK